MRIQSAFKQAGIVFPDKGTTGRLSGEVKGRRITAQEEAAIK
jgi:hypothetical protein